MNWIIKVILMVVSMFIGLVMGLNCSGYYEFRAQGKKPSIWDILYLTCELVNVIVKGGER